MGWGNGAGLDWVGLGRVTIGGVIVYGAWDRYDLTLQTGTRPEPGGEGRRKKKRKRTRTGHGWRGNRQLGWVR